MSADGDTKPEKRRARGWSGPESVRSNGELSELPEPLIDPPPNRVAIEALHGHVIELHHDVRDLRNEFSSKQEAQRQAIYNVAHDVTRIDAGLKGLRTVVNDALQKQRAQQRMQFWVSVLGTVMLAALLILFVLRIYRHVGI